MKLFSPRFPVSIYWSSIHKGGNSAFIESNIDNNKCHILFGLHAKTTRRMARGALDLSKQQLPSLRLSK